MPAFSEKVTIEVIDNGFLVTKYNSRDEILYRSVCEAPFSDTANLETPYGDYDRSMVFAFQALVLRLIEAFGIEACLVSAGMELRMKLVDNPDAHKISREIN